MAHLRKGPNAGKGRDGDRSERNEWENGEEQKGVICVWNKLLASTLLWLSLGLDCLRVACLAIKLCSSQLFSHVDVPAGGWDERSECLHLHRAHGSKGPVGLGAGDWRDWSAARGACLCACVWRQHSWSSCWVGSEDCGLDSGGAGGLIASYWRDHRSGPAAREPRVCACW